MGRVLRSLRVTIKQFFEQTTINGFIYVADVANHIVVKVGWFVLVIVFMALAMYLVILSFNDWKTNPTVTTIDSAAFPIEELPFPSVTVCQEDQGIRFLSFMSLNCKILWQTIFSRSPEKWAITERILNYAQWSCNDQSGPTCTASETLCTIPELKRPILAIMEKLFEVALGNDVFQNKYPPSQYNSWDTISAVLDSSHKRFIQSYVNLMVNQNGPNDITEAEIQADLFDIFVNKTTESGLVTLADLRPYLNEKNG